MRIEFVLPKHNLVARSFCNLMVRWIKNDIRRHTNMFALQIRINQMLEDNLIQWVGKAEDVSALQLLNIVLKHIDWGMIRKRYIIEIDPRAVFPNSTTSLALIVRYINYGTLSVKGCFFVSNVFRKYQENVYRYFLMYRMKIAR